MTLACPWDAKRFLLTLAGRAPKDGRRVVVAVMRTTYAPLETVFVNGRSHPARPDWRAALPRGRDTALHPAATVGPMAPGKRKSRTREKPDVPVSDYADAEGNILTLRGVLKPGARREYAQTLAGEHGGPAATNEDAWQRAVELLFERLVIRWTISGAPLERQKELLARFRIASQAERAWVRDALRQHCAEHFPELPAP